MSDVQLRGLLRVHNKNRRSQKELAHHQERELAPSFLSQDKSGRCYTYRGVKYCYR